MAESSPTVAYAGQMARPPRLDEVTRAIEASWSDETCDEADRADWRPGNPSRGQCGVSALVLHDHLGGVLLLADVTVDGVRTGFHYWNRLPDGRELDLTRAQFAADEIVGEPAVVIRPPGPVGRSRAQYELLAARVSDRLGS
jgi:hypothetical protein